ncbi:hypothetical protein [Marinimicrococcus flavescens]|uniref:Uncharacterized protein n=1 Tax=Marinimicrococcus flavescens TaxID=3031815 RepID=A0AAP4D5I6_9PROT|nr:hypothetical protein [Marinimicrococcus flavescens]
MKDLETLLGATTKSPPGQLARLLDGQGFDAATYATLKSTLMLHALLALLDDGQDEEGPSRIDEITGLLREVQASNAAILQAQAHTVALLEELLALARDSA